MSEEVEYRPGQFAKKGEWRTVNQRDYRFDGKWWEPMATGHHVIGAYDTPEELFSYEMPGPLAGSLARQLQYQLDQARKERDQLREALATLTDKWLSEAVDLKTTKGQAHKLVYMSAEVRDLLPEDTRYNNGQ